MTVRALQGLLSISVDEINPSPANPRQHLTDIDDLAASIREVGLIQPLVVQRVPSRPGVQIIAGHRRHAAALKLGMTELTCVVRRDLLPDEELLTMLIENGQRADLDPIEEARAVQQLHRADMSKTDIARRVGRHPNWVHERLMLLDLSPAEQEEVRAGHYTLRHALSIVRTGRAQQRHQENPVARPVGRPKGAKTRPYFGDTHPLASTVRRLCTHIGKPKVGAVGCGGCWENAIRADEQSIHAQDGAA